VVPDSHRRVLATVLDRLSSVAVPWAISGSVALALHGLPASCEDLDLITSADGAHELERVLGPIVLEPVSASERGQIRGHIGRVQIEEIEVELLGDVQNRVAGRDWTTPPRLHADVIDIDYDGRTYPVVTLACLRDSYVTLRRWDKVRLIDQSIASGAEAVDEPGPWPPR
jgi:hypothetical protein